jgi:hypothetical protein
MAFRGGLANPKKTKEKTKKKKITIEGLPLRVAEPPLRVMGVGSATLD